MIACLSQVHRTNRFLMKRVSEEALLESVFEHVKRKNRFANNGIHMRYYLHTS